MKADCSGSENRVSTLVGSLPSNIFRSWKRLDHRAPCHGVKASSILVGTVHLDVAELVRRYVWSVEDGGSNPSI